MILVEKKAWDRSIRIAGLAWGFCAGALFEQDRSKPKPPAAIVIKGVEF